MRLEEALAQSTVGAATIPAVADIVYCRDGTVWWWLTDHYIQRDEPPGEDSSP